MRSLPDDTNWAVTEFADAELGDVRRTKRLVELAGVLAQHPTAMLPEACGDGAMLKAAYRFFSNDDIEPQDFLYSHIESTYSRLDKVPLVLAVQDTTEVDWTGHPATKGLGPLDIRRVKACTSTARWRSHPSVSPWGFWPSTCGPVIPTTLASASGASSCPLARRKARNGSPVLRRFSVLGIVVRQRALSI